MRNWQLSKKKNQKLLTTPEALPTGSQIVLPDDIVGTARSNGDTNSETRSKCFDFFNPSRPAVAGRISL